MTTRTITTSSVLALLLGITACAAPSQPFLDSARAACTAGDQDSCRMVPIAQSQVNAEHAQQAREVAAGLALGLAAVAAGAAAGYEAAQPHYYYTPAVVCGRRGCW